MTHPAITLLTTLFEPSDLLLFRPVETWTEGGRKRSRVDHKNICYRPARVVTIERTLQRLELAADEQRTNLFFGVCPRFGDKGRFDLAWQIRTVRCLWADIDNCTIEQAVERCRSRGLPKPTAIVNSGNGAHVYWRLDQPFLIDDVENPPAVECEWTAGPDGRKRARRYVLDGNDRIYTDQRHHITKLSPKSLRIQDQLAGIAEAVGGDHTTDLTRLLRLPGTWNRKDQRNGKEPVLATLVDCDKNRRCSLEAFAQFTKPCAASQRESMIAAMPLPKVRNVSARKSDKLAELVAACTIAPPGTRSQADFALCCFAIRGGVSKEEVWAQVRSIGKFAEQGARYFELTWSSAEYDVRTALCDKLQKTLPTASRSMYANEPDGEFEFGQYDTADQTPRITIAPRFTPVAETMGLITNQLLETRECYTRQGQLVVIRNEAIRPILSPVELTGLLSQHVEFYYVGDNGGEFKPLTSAYSGTWLNNAVQRERLPEVKLFSHGPIYSDDWRLLKPGYDRATGYYYAGPEIKPVEGTKHLDTLLGDFCWKEPGDRTNYIGILLTGLLVSRFIGSKPAALFNGNQAELGKSTLTQILAILRDGQQVDTATFNSNDEEFEKRLGTIVKNGATTIVIDNAKTRGRNGQIDSACLERSITDPILSFRMLGFSKEIRTENSHLFCITANSPEVSRDLITRCVVVNLHHEGDPKLRSFRIQDPEEYAQTHRLQLLGELVHMVERWKSAGMPLSDVKTRFNKKGWGNVVGGILEANGEPDFMINADEAASDLDSTRREFHELVEVMARHPQGNWTASELTNLACDQFLLQAELGEGTPRSKTTRMGKLASRFIHERFPLDDEEHAVFTRSRDGQYNRYQIYRISSRENLSDLLERLKQTSGDLF